MQFARYIPLPWFREQHKVGLNDPKLDPYVEEVCRMGLQKGIMIIVMCITWSWIMIPVLIVIVVQRFFELIQPVLKTLFKLINTYSGLYWAFDKLDQLEQKRINHAIESRKKAGYG